MYVRTGKPRRYIFQEWDDFDQILSRRENLARPLQRGCNHVHDLIVIVRNVDVEQNFDYRCGKCTAVIQ